MLLDQEKPNHHVAAFSRTLQKSETWIRELHKDFNWLDGDGVYHVLRAVLHTLRDQLSINEAAQLSAQLPLLLKGTFFEGWTPSPGPTRGLEKNEFLNAVRLRLNMQGRPNFELESGVRNCLKVVLGHLSPGEVHDIAVTLKPSLRNFFEAAANQSELRPK